MTVGEGKGGTNIRTALDAHTQELLHPVAPNTEVITERESALTGMNIRVDVIKGVGPRIRAVPVIIQDRDMKIPGPFSQDLCHRTHILVLAMV